MGRMCGQSKNTRNNGTDYISTLENLRKAGVEKSSNQSFLFYSPNNSSPVVLYLYVSPYSTISCLNTYETPLDFKNRASEL